MLIGEVRYLAAAWSAFYKAFFYQIRLIHVLYGAGVFAQGGGYGVESNRATVEFGDDGVEYLIVDFVKAVAVDIQGLKGITGYFHID